MAEMTQQLHSITTQQKQQIWDFSTSNTKAKLSTYVEYFSDQFGFAIRPSTMKHIINNDPRNKKNPPVIDMVMEAITELRQPRGSSIHSIKKYISHKYSYISIDNRLNKFIHRALKKGIATHKILSTMGNSKNLTGKFKLAPEARPYVYKHLHYDVNSVQCSKCGKTKTKNRKNIRCYCGGSGCRKIYRYETSYIRHLEKINNQTVSRCDMCGLLKDPQDEFPDAPTTLKTDEEIPAHQRLPFKLVDPAIGCSLYVKTSDKVNTSWEQGKLIQIIHSVRSTSTYKYEIRLQNKMTVMADICNLASLHAPDTSMPIGTRVIAVFKDDGDFYAGIIAESPCLTNQQRYLVFFDDGDVQYCSNNEVRQVYKQSEYVWRDVTVSATANFICDYLTHKQTYTELMKVQISEGDHIKVEYEGEWWDTKVAVVDCNILMVIYDKDHSEEWIYRGSRRLHPIFIKINSDK